MTPRRLITAPATNAVTRDEAKAHARIENADEDAIVDVYLATACATIEELTRRRFVDQTWDFYFDAFEEPIVVPLAPVLSIESITYVDTDGDTQTWSSSNYVVDNPGGPSGDRASIRLASGASFPATNGEPRCVVVRVRVGYDVANPVPAALKAAALMLFGHLYANREPVIVGSIASAIPMTVDYLVAPYRLFEFA